MQAAIAFSFFAIFPWVRCRSVFMSVSYDFFIFTSELLCCSFSVLMSHHIKGNFRGLIAIPDVTPHILTLQIASVNIILWGAAYSKVKWLKRFMFISSACLIWCLCYNSHLFLLSRLQLHTLLFWGTNKGQTKPLPQAMRLNPILQGVTTATQMPQTLMEATRSPLLVDSLPSLSQVLEMLLWILDTSHSLRHEITEGKAKGSSAVSHLHPPLLPLSSNVL